MSLADQCWGLIILLKKLVILSCLGICIWNEFIKTKQRLNEIYSKHTGRKLNEVADIMERDRYFSPDEAIKFGLIDKIVENRK